METMTSAFSLSTRSHHGVQLDNIIFYSCPASTNVRKAPPIDADEWPDVDMIFMEASQQEWMGNTEQLDPAGGLETTVEGEIPGIQSIPARQR